MNSNFEILKGLPPHGKMYVPIPEGNWSEGLPVEFTKDDGTKWVANIKYGKEGFDYIKELKHPTEILVISNGQCFIVDRNQEKSIVEFGFDFKEVIEFENKYCIIGNRNIAIIENSNNYKFHEYVCRDYIDNVKIDNGILNGIFNEYNAWDKYDKTKFLIDLKTFELTRSKKVFKPRKVNELKTNESKKWWKIWK